MRPVPEVDKASVVFGGIDHMPKEDEIPDEFWNMNNQTKWNRIISRWFFSGLPKETEFFPKEGVDAKKAIRAIAAIIGSFAPKHEHKEAACAYLLSEWFDDVRVPEQTKKPA